MTKKNTAATGRVILYCLIIFSAPGSLMAQLNEQYFAADHLKEGGKILSYIKTDSTLFVEGRTLDVGNPGASYIAAVGTNGQAKWISDLLPYYDPAVNLQKMIVGGDGDVCCVAVKAQATQLWKLDAATGTRLWTIDLPQNSIVRYLAQQGSDRFALPLESNGYTM